MPDTTTDKKQWCTLDSDAVVGHFESSREGLTSEVVRKRLEEFGANKLPTKKPDTFFTIFIRQFQSPLLYILMLAAVVALLLGEITDGLIIIAVLILNGVVGAIQEGKAQDSLFALKKFTETESLVVRDGKNVIVPSLDLVPGDIILLKEGDKIPADARIIETKDLVVDEAALTGESKPVQKTSETLSEGEEIVVSDQTNMLFKGTHISAGRGRAVVVATGTKTEIGKISEKISTIESDIPLQKSIRRLARLIIIAVLIIIALLFVLGLATGNTAREMLLVSISLLVSVIPEGLPIVMTLILAQGVKRMSEKQVLVKRLQAVEALGQAKIIAVDKTGTLTKNELVVQRVYTHHKLFEITGVGYDPEGDAVLDGETLQHHPAIARIAFLCGLSGNAEVFRGEEETKVTGDPTEAAILVFGEKFGYVKRELLQKHAMVGEIPFDFKKKYYINVHENGNNGNFLIDTGAPEAILPLCTKQWTPEGDIALTAEDIKTIEDRVHEMSEQGLRVIAVATKDGAPADIKDSDLTELTFVGFVAMKDALRTEVAHAMEEAHRAGMKVVMITGDHAVTATAIAREAGVYSEGDDVLSGVEIKSMTDEELSERIQNVTVFARVTPEHKLRIIEAYKRAGNIIAMTGDGVNDVPSLVAANLGVGMGKIGTEVAKEAADIVLLDDNFGNIPRAVEEGRNIFSTIKKTLLFLFSTNLAELLVIVFAVVMLLPIPLTPAQIVWLNLVTDSFLVMALAFLPRDADLLRGNYPKPSKYILGRAAAFRLVLFGLIITIGTLFVFVLYRSADLTMARTMAFITLSLFQFFRLWSVRSDTQSIFSESPLKLPWLLTASLVAIGLQLLAIYAPFMNKLLETVPLGPVDWLIAIGVAATIIAIDEIRKFDVRRKQQKKPSSV